MRKRLLCVFLCGLLMASIFAGCGKKTQEGSIEPVTEKPVSETFVDYEGTLTGKVVGINMPYSVLSESITVTMAVENDPDQLVVCYRMKGMYADSLQVGDSISVTGCVTNYEGIVQFKKGCWFVPALETVPEPGFEPEPEEQPRRELVLVTEDDWDDAFGWVDGQLVRVELDKIGVTYGAFPETRMTDVFFACADEEGYRQSMPVKLKDNDKTAAVVLAQDDYSVLYDRLPKGIRKLTARIPESRFMAMYNEFEPGATEEYMLPCFAELDDLHFIYIRDTTDAINIACIGDEGAYWDTGEIALAPNGKNVFIDLTQDEFLVQYSE